MFYSTVLLSALLECPKKILVNQGGTSSAKTFTILQVLFKNAVEEPNSVITIVGQDIPNLKKGAYRDAETIYSQSEVLKQQVVQWNKTDRTIYFRNGSLMEFVSYGGPQDAKNGKRDYLFVNEANGVDYNIYWQLAIRTRKKIFIDYNPSAPFWVHDSLIGQPDVALIVSDHRHNVFLGEEEHRKIEQINDGQLWRVYSRGRVGNISGLIFPNWQKIPDEQFPHEEPFFGGLDFGYTNDPTAGVKIVRVGDNIFIKELCYTTGLSAMNLKQVFAANGFTGQIPVYCEHDPQMGAQLRRLGMLVLSAIKGPGSLNAGIEKLREFKVFYTAGSTNLHQERMRYVWIQNPATGQHTNTPIDQFNHLMDAIRYGVYSHYFKGRG